MGPHVLCVGRVPITIQFNEYIIINLHLYKSVEIKDKQVHRDDEFINTCPV